MAAALLLALATFKAQNWVKVPTPSAVQVPGVLQAQQQAAAASQLLVPQSSSSHRAGRERAEL
jgi:hypothetical protein